MTGSWTLTHNAKEHNHTKAHPSGLANHRRRLRTEEVKAFLTNARTVGIQPKRARLQAKRLFNGGQYIIAKNLYNERVRSRGEELKGRTPMERATEMLDTSYTWIAKQPTGGELTHVFFSNKNMLPIHCRLGAYNLCH